MALNIDRAVRTSLARWKRREVAEDKTPFVIEQHRDWKHPRLMRLGRVSVLDWGDGPRLDMGGGTIYGLPGGLDLLRIPTDQDVIAINATVAGILAAQRAADRTYLRAFKRGRRPTVEEIQEASAQVHAEVPE